MSEAGSLFGASGISFVDYLPALTKIGKGRTACRHFSREQAGLTICFTPQNAGSKIIILYQSNADNLKNSSFFSPEYKFYYIVIPVIQYITMKGEI